MCVRGNTQNENQDVMLLRDVNKENQDALFLGDNKNENQELRKE